MSKLTWWRKKCSSKSSCADIKPHRAAESVVLINTLSSLWHLFYNVFFSSTNNIAWKPDRMLYFLQLRLITRNKKKKMKKKEKQYVIYSTLLWQGGFGKVVFRGPKDPSGDRKMTFVSLAIVWFRCTLSWNRMDHLCPQSLWTRLPFCFLYLTSLQCHFSQYTT